MGRQKGQSQRTKGNVQPSSSRRAAFMLAENQKFVGFNAMSGELGYVPMLKSLENDIEAVIDPDFRVALSKVNKKDAITKVKALTELAELLETKTVDDTLVILPYWPRLYNKLCDDSDRKVRESCQIAFRSIIKSVGKNIAPHLKGIMGWWWIAQSDSHAPVMSAATDAFAAAFPTLEKQKKALIFCHQEIVQCLSANIFSNLKLQVSASMSNEEKDIDRTVSASLNALAAFLKALDVNGLKDIPVQPLQDIYLNSKLWKFSKHQNPSIRAAFYSVVSSFCCYIPDIVKLHLATTAKSIMHKLNEPNPVVSKSIWVAENSFTSVFNDWYENIDIRKGFLPQLWALIKNGFHGNSKLVGDQLAPLLSRFPPSLTVVPVYKELLNCFFVSLSDNNVLRSSIETKSILKSNFDCMNEILKKLLDASAEWNFKLVNLVWDQHIMPLLKKSLTQQNFSVLFHKLFAQFLKNWFLYEKNISVNKDNFYQICSVIWNDLTEFGEELTLKVQTVSSEDETKFVSFLQLLFEIKLVSSEPNKEVKLQSKKVHFSAFDKASVQNNAINYSKNTETICLLTNYLEQCILKCLCNSLNSSCSSMCKLIILSNILRRFASVSLFRNYSKPNKKNIDPAFFLLNTFIFPIINDVIFEDCSKEQCHSIASLIYFILKHCEHNITSNFVITFNQLVNNGKNVCIFLTQLVLKDEEFFSKIDNVEWMTKYIIKLIQELADINVLQNNEKWNLVCYVLTQVTLLKVEVIVTIINSLNSSSIKQTADNLIQINKILSGCFSTHCERCLDLDCWSVAFYKALLPLLEQICEEPQVDLVVCLKQTICILLKTSYNSNKFDTKNLVLEICNCCATHLSKLLFKRNFDLKSFDGFKRAIVLIAEELAINHIDQSCISHWLDCVLPADNDFCLLRPSIDSGLWVTCQSVNNKFEPTLSTKLVDKKYFVAVKTFLDLASDLSSIFSETYTDIFLHPRYKTLFIELLLAKAIVTTDWSDLIEITDFFLCKDSFLHDIVDCSLKIGNGWILILSQFAYWANKDYWREDVFMQLIHDNTYDISNFKYQVLLIFSKKSMSVANLTTVLTWSMQKFLKNCFSLEKFEDAEFNPDILSLLVVLFEKISLLQDNKPIYINDDNTPVHLQIIEKIIGLKSTCADLFLFDVDFTQAKPKHVMLNSAIVNFLQCLVDICPCALTASNWDFIECSFVSWMESCCVTYKGNNNTLSANISKIFFDVCNLMVALENFITSPVAISDPSLPPSLPNEWEEFFKPAAHCSLIQIYKRLSTLDVHERLLQIIDNCLNLVTSSTLVSAASTLETHLLPGSNLSDDIQTLLHHFGTFLVPKNSTHISIHQSISYTLINKLVGVIFAGVDSTDNIEPPLQLLKILEKLMPEVVESIDLLKFKMIPQKKQSRVDSNDDKESLSSSESADNDDESETELEEITTDLLSENSFLYSFFLVWKLLVALIDFIPSKEKSQYVATLARDPLTDISSLLSKLKVVLPHIPHYFLNDKSQKKINFFKDDFDVRSLLPGYLKIQHLACSLYKDILIHFPVYARIWFTSLNKGDRAYMDEYTATHVTNVICGRELDLVSMCKTPSGLTIRSRKVSREVVAIYEISDATFEIAIELPPNYPLTPVHVNTVSKVGVAATQWRYWILQMTMVLHRQNGTIVDALLVWKDKVDKKLEGVEECMICFSVVHGTNTHSLPKLQCRTCRKKYHAECLYKWFDTSNQSTCPLCRSPMMFK